MYRKIIVNLEDPGIDPGTSRMLSGRSTIWANPPASENENVFTLSRIFYLPRVEQ